MIPFHKSYIAGNELEYVAQAIRSGQVASDGPFTRQCAELLASRFDIAKVLMTPSCTAALEMAAILCDLGPGDEVIMPSFAFVSAANAVIRTGAKPVFVDIRPDTLNLDESFLEDAITPRTKAILVIHYGGVGCAMDRIMEIAEKHALRVIEDAAQAVMAFYKGRALGSIGHLGTYSFHDSKNYSCGEGGALCINDPQLVERAETIREKGTNRSKFFRGQVDKYTWVDVGSSYLPSEISCAFLYAQLELLSDLLERRKRLYSFYRQRLAPLAERGLLRLPVVPGECDHNAHLFPILLPDSAIRDALMAHLRTVGIWAVFHFLPLHSSPMGKSLGCDTGTLSVTTNLSERLLRLPLYYEVTEAEQERVIREIEHFLEM